MGIQFNMIRFLLGFALLELGSTRIQCYTGSDIQCFETDLAISKSACEYRFESKLKVMDTDKDGFIGKEEWVSYYLKKHNPYKTESILNGDWKYWFGTADKVDKAMYTKVCLGMG